MKVEVLLYFQLWNFTSLTIKLSYWIKKLVFGTNIKYRGVLSEQSNWLLACTLVSHKFRLHYNTQKMAVLSKADLSVFDFASQWSNFITVQLLKTDCWVFSPSMIVLVLSWVIVREARWSWRSDIFQSQCWEICARIQFLQKSVRVSASFCTWMVSWQSRLEKKYNVVRADQEADGSRYSWSIISPL